MDLESYLEMDQSYAQDTIKAAEGFVDSRLGVVREVHLSLVEPDDPKLFCTAAELADVSRYTGREYAAYVGGVGLTGEIAKAAAIGEAIERYCASFCDEDKIVHGSYRELISQGHLATKPDDFALYSQKQYEHGFVDYKPFTADTKLGWISGYSLLRKEPIMIPACLIYMPYEPSINEVSVAPAVSTGLSCARNREHSIVTGIYEVVERDAITIAWLNKLSMPRVNLHSSKLMSQIFDSRFTNPCSSSAQWHLVNVTNDHGIPSMLALYVDESKDGYATANGSAANLDPELAASRALLEAAQTRNYAKALSRGQIPTDGGKVSSFAYHVRLYSQTRSVPRLKFLYSSSTMRNLDKHSVRSPGSDRDRIHLCLKMLENVATDIIVVDVTTEDVAELGFCVTKVLIPNFQPLTLAPEFLGGKRLYDVPPKLGYVGLAEEELNQFPHPFP